MKRFTENGKTIIFYKKEGDKKYSFKIEGDDTLTEWLLSNVKTKRVTEDKILYAKKGIFDKIKQYKKVSDTPRRRSNNSTKDAVSLLNELCQKRWKSPIICRTLGKFSGTDLIHVEIELPNGRIYEDMNLNQRIARHFAALEALYEEFNIDE